MSGVVHIGIDAGNFAVLDGLAARGLMPAYASLKERAAHGVLSSTTPWFTVPGWVSLMTGVPAHQHGMAYWTTAKPRDHWRKERGVRLVSSADIPYPTLFEVASDAGRRVASLNMPVTFPPTPVNGVMVSGFLGPTDPERVAHPRGFLRRYPDYGVDVESGPGRDEERTEDRVLAVYAERLSAMAAERARVAIDLIREGYDLVSVVFVGPDRLLHVAWPAVAALLDGEGPPTGPAAAAASYYRALDDALGAIVRAAENRLVMVTSDHGQGPPPSRLLAVNDWLRERGWLAGHHGSVRRLARAIPRGARQRLWDLFVKVRRRPIHAAPLVDWERSAAYGIAFPHCNLVGVALREPHSGMLAEVAGALGALTDPETGRPLVTEVIRGADFATGPGLESYPDLLAVLDRDIGVSPGLTFGPWMRENPDPANGAHDIEGLVLAAGPGVEPRSHPARPIWDVAPTILAALGVDPPAHVEAEPIAWAVPVVTGGAESAGAPATAPTAAERGMGQAGLTAEEEEAVSRHLRDLGYLE